MRSAAFRQGLLTTLHGEVCCEWLHDVSAHRVGFAPAPCEWTPWAYATDGRFTGRWDDPDGVWRTLYLGASRLACYLEVLAFARPSAEVLAELDDIVVDEVDQARFPSLPRGHLPRRWCGPRFVVDAALSGWFALPGNPETLASLRAGFRALALSLGLDDLDGAAIRDARPRALTQAISRWLYTLTGPDEHPVAGVGFDSRHGDGLRLWAVYERPGDPAVSPRITPLDKERVTVEDPDLMEAMRLLDIVWED